MLQILNYFYMKMEKQLDYECKNGRPYWCLDYYKNDMILYDINGAPVISAPDSLYLIPPDVPSIHRSAGKRAWIHTSLLFQADSDSMERFSIPYMTPISVSDPHELEQLLFDMNSHKLSQSELSNDALNAYLSLILIHTHDMLHRMPSDYTVNVGEDLQVVRNIIMNSTHMEWTIDKMAALANMSPRHFARKYKISYGISPIADLYQFRFTRAKRLLESGFSINHILNSCGFKSEQHFSAFFKRHAGMTPGEYRSRQKKAPQASRAGKPAEPGALYQDSRKRDNND